MADFDASRVAEMRRELEGLVPKGGALVEVRDVHRRETDGFELRANRLGFLRLGIECLGSGLQLNDTRSRRDAYERLEYLGTWRGESVLELYRQDDIRIEEEPPAMTPEEERRRNRRADIVGWCFGAAVWGCVLVGAFEIVRWIVRMF